MKNTLSKENFKKLLEAQLELNKKYSGEDWADKIPESKFRKAVLCEYGELLQSVEPNWAWWKKSELDEQNAVIEIIDVLHFALSLLLMRKSIDELVELFDENYELNDSNVDETLALAKFMLASIPSYFQELILSMCYESNIDQNRVWEGYFKKNALNHKRVESGYKEGKYKKIDEKGNEDNRQLDV